jgi:hypothetical protein
VLLGLVLIAVGWIVAGLWMIHAGEKSWRVRH